MASLDEELRRLALSQYVAEAGGFRDMPLGGAATASTGGPTAVSPFTDRLARMIEGGPAPMEPDLLGYQRGETFQPGMTKRPDAIPLTTDAQTGELMFATPKLFDLLGAGTGGSFGAGRAISSADEIALGVGGARRGKIGHNGGPELAKYERYAEVYPETGPPVLSHKVTMKPIPGVEGGVGEGAAQAMVDAKEAYWGKQLTPEAVAFQKERARIMKDMEKRGYEKYFNPEERAYVDPSNYPPNTNTLDIVPKMQKTIDADMAKIGSEDARARLQAAFEKGSTMPDAKDWYAMKQLEDEFIKELGPEAGRRAFQDRFATSMAATTGGADPTSNLLMAQYGNYLRQHDLPYPAGAYEMPFPIGGRYAAGNMEMHQKVFDKGGWDALGESNPKRHNFAQNFTGNRGVATMDEQMTSGMTPGVQMPPPGKYGLYERVLHEEAAKAGVDPANFQDVAWAGFKNDKVPGFSGQPMIDIVNESIERTHRLTGMPKEEIVRRGLVRSEIPMYGVAPGVSNEILARILEDEERR